MTLEWIAASLGLISVWLTVRRHILCWPTGLAMVLLYLVIFYRAKLYSDMLLQVVYVALQIYGWYAWLHGGQNRQSLVVSRLPRWQIAPWLLAGTLMTLVTGTAMDRFTDAASPYADATVTQASLIAQWFMGRKILDSWPVWIFVDVVSIGLFWTRGLYPTAGLYAIFLVMAIWGWKEWSEACHTPDMA